MDISVCIFLLVGLVSAKHNLSMSASAVYLTTPNSAIRSDLSNKCDTEWVDSHWIFVYSLRWLPQVMLFARFHTNLFSHLDRRPPFFTLRVCLCLSMLRRVFLPSFWPSFLDGRRHSSFRRLMTNLWFRDDVCCCLIFTYFGFEMSNTVFSQN